MPVQRRPQGRDQFGRGGVFQHEPGGAGFQRPARIRHLLMHGEEDNLHARVVLLEQPQRIQPVQVRHGDVRHDHIGVQFLRRVNQGAPVLHHPHQIELGAEQASQTLGHHAVVVGEKNAGTRHKERLKAKG